MTNGIFGNLFDFDGDGKLDSAELAADYMAFDRIMDCVNDTDDNLDDILNVDEDDTDDTSDDFSAVDDMDNDGDF